MSRRRSHCPPPDLDLRTEHTHDGMRLSVKLEHAADRGRITSELPAPEALTEHDDSFTARSILGCSKPPAEDRREPPDVKEVERPPSSRHPDRLRHTGQGVPRVDRCGQLLERSVGVSEIDEIRKRYAAAICALLSVDTVDKADRVGILERQRA